MSGALTAAQLTGLEQTHLVTLPGGHRLQPETAEALHALQADARAAGFDLAVASAFRSFERQLAIWNGKVRGERRVQDDHGRDVDLASLAPAARLAAILRYSALPGASRHHWGTDLDVYDAAAMPEGYQLQLTPAEVAAGGLFDALHRWLDARMAADRSHGFFRPYARDRGGVAPERWHLSYAPLAAACERAFCAGVLRASWDRGAARELLLRDEIERQLPELVARYVAVSGNWCPACYRG